MLFHILNPSPLGRPFEDGQLPNSAGEHFETTVSDILTHVALRRAYHRGQVAHLLRQAGAEPQPTDYIPIVRGASAAKNQ